jgi:hypothetical protein
LAAGFEYGVYGYSDFTPPSTTEYYTQLGTGKMQQSGAMASASQTLFRDRLVLMVAGGKLWQLRNAVIGTPQDYEALQFSVGAKVMLGEHFSTYAYYTDIRNHVGQNVNLGQAPLYSDKLGTPAAYLAPGNDPRAMGVGVMARF